MRPKERGAALRRRRERKNFSQRQLAFLADCSHAFIGQLENDKTGVTPKLAARIARYLEVDVEDLFEEHRLPAVAQMPTSNAGTSHTPSSVQRHAGQVTVTPEVA